MALAPGKRLGNYTIADAIGAGGMDEVYRATDTKLGRDVAIKVLPEELRRDDNHRAHRIFEISPDGERFLVLVNSGEDPTPTELHVTTNWVAELE